MLCRHPLSRLPFCLLVILLTVGAAAAHDATPTPRAPVPANEIRLPVVLSPAPPGDLPDAPIVYGDKILYWGPGTTPLPEIVTIRPDGTGKTQRTFGGTVAQYATQPAWSPDHERIAYNLFDRFGGRLTIIELNGDARRGDGPFGLAWLGDAAWSPDGQRLAFVGVEPDPDDPDIWITTPALVEATNLTPYLSSNDSDPAWSPDGARIVFRHEYHNGISLRAELAIMSDSGGDIIPLPSTGPDASAPDWSPDGATILYTGDVAGGGRGLFTVPVGGGAPTLLLPGATDGAWSPDGRYLVFVGADGRLYVAHADGGGAFLIDPSPYTATPDW
ncbi:TolB family protein [Promineifilum sp.]|uniref:TolB family protein n=1 Tax=Promineifilum sp. TaxID=2664178 RepID=UPI0035B40743